MQLFCPANGDAVKSFINKNFQEQRAALAPAAFVYLRMLSSRPARARSIIIRLPYPANSHLKDLHSKAGNAFSQPRENFSYNIYDL